MIGNCNLDEIIGKTSRSKTDENELNDNAGGYRSHFENISFFFFNMVLFYFSSLRRESYSANGITIRLQVKNDSMKRGREEPRIINSCWASGHHLYVFFSFSYTFLFIKYTCMLFYVIKILKKTLNVYVNINK